MSLSEMEYSEIYRRMLRIRYFEEAVMANHIAGHLSIGQEGAIVGASVALNDDDYVTGSHRSHGHPIGKGASLPPLMAELMGKVTGICKGRGGSMHLTDVSCGSIGESAIVGGQLPLAVGAGLSAQLKGAGQVSLCFFGDGAANQGTFGESLNLAAIWKLPVIFFCENNLYAITTSVDSSHGQPDIAKRAEGYGMPGVIVDGQDVMAVYKTTQQAVKRARANQGPTLIEAKTYRFDEHARELVAPFPYRSEDEVAHYTNQRDPIANYLQFLTDNQGIDKATLSSIRSEVKKEVEEAVDFAKNSEFPQENDIGLYMYSDPVGSISAVGGK